MKETAKQVHGWHQDTLVKRRDRKSHEKKVVTSYDTQNNKTGQKQTQTGAKKHKKMTACELESTQGNNNAFWVAKLERMGWNYTKKATRKEQDRMQVAVALPNAKVKTPKHHFGHFQSLEQNADGTNRLVKYDQLLVFCSNPRLF